jgi:hypothetical protein
MSARTLMSGYHRLHRAAGGDREDSPPYGPEPCPGAQPNRRFARCVGRWVLPGRRIRSAPSSEWPFASRRPGDSGLPLTSVFPCIRCSRSATRERQRVRRGGAGGGWFGGRTADRRGAPDTDIPLSCSLTQRGRPFRHAGVDCTGNAPRRACGRTHTPRSALVAMRRSSDTPTVSILPQAL